VLEEETDGNLDLLAQAAGPDIPQDDRLPDVDLPGVEDASDILRQDTRSRLSLMHN
jgi:NADPH-dependent glutamate synthase beta subunit-like oxidoreductase